jgi:hypothetical protein
MSPTNNKPDITSEELDRQIEEEERREREMEAKFKTATVLCEVCGCQVPAKVLGPTELADEHRTVLLVDDPVHSCQANIKLRAPTCNKRSETT